MQDINQPSTMNDLASKKKSMSKFDNFFGTLRRKQTSSTTEQISISTISLASEDKSAKMFSSSHRSSLHIDNSNDVKENRYPDGIATSNTRVSGKHFQSKTPNGHEVDALASGMDKAHVNGSTGRKPAFPSMKPIQRIDDIPVLKPEGFIGMETLPYQLTKRANNSRFQFNMLCVGDRGIGKTTLIESLFNRKFEFEPCTDESNKVSLCVSECKITEGAVTCQLKIVETAGYGNHFDTNNGAKLITNYIDDQFEKYLKEELKVKRCMMLYNDTRIHCCLFFIYPTGHGLRPLDVETMKALSKKVNIIPIIAKADTTCRDELTRFKAKILEDLKSNGIDIYQFPIDDETVKQANETFNNVVPFAVIGSTEFVIRENGKHVRARKYPWGIVEVENEEHCDFVKMREAVLRLNVDALREKTHEELYENYRRERLSQMNMKDGDMGPKMMEALVERQNAKESEMKRRYEEFKKTYQKKVHDKEAELKSKEESLNIRQRQSEEKIYEEIRRVDEQIAALEEEKRRFQSGGCKIERGGSKKSTSTKKL